VAHMVNKAADNEFRAGVLAANTRHCPASLLWSQIIHDASDRKNLIPRRPGCQEKNTISRGSIEKNLYILCLQQILTGSTNIAHLDERI